MAGNMIGTVTADKAWDADTREDLTAEIVLIQNVHDDEPWIAIRTYDEHGDEVGCINLQFKPERFQDLISHLTLLAKMTAEPVKRMS